MAGLFRRATAVAAVLLTLANQAQAATYYYYRGGAQPSETTGTKPPSPAPDGTFAILVDGPSPDVAIRGSSYSATTYAYGNAGQVVFSIAAGALPAGLSINATTGTIAGVPTTVGTASFTVKGVDVATGRSATETVALDTVDPFSITGSPAANVVLGNSYSATFTLAGGGQPYAFGTLGLPDGLTLTTSATTATISGTPTTGGIVPITVVGSESHGMSVQYPFNLNVVTPLTISGSPPATATVGTAYSGQMTFSGGLSPYTFSVAAGSLPTGITLKSATGVISGVPSSAGTRTGIKVKVVDAAGQTATSTAFSITVSPAGAVQPLTISGVPSQTATEGSPYFTQFTAGGGTSPYVYSLANGTLPAGITFNPTTGILSGSPQVGTTGTYPGIVIRVTDALGNTANAASFTIIVSASAPTLTISGSPPGSAVVGSPYSTLFTASGGAGGGYTFALNSGTLPPGLTIAPNGLLQGVPTTAGTYSGIRIRVTDSAAKTAISTAFSINVTTPPPLTIQGTPQATVMQDASYSATWTAFDGSGTGYHFTSVGGPLPPGLTLSDINGAQGLLSGTATTAGSYPGLQIRVVDSAGGTAVTAPFSVTVTPPALAVNGAPSATAELGQGYSALFNATGGSGGYVFSAAGGTLPPGLLVETSGLLHGIPTAVGNYPNLVVKVVDQGGATAFSAPFSITVSDSDPLTVAWSPQLSWSVGDAFAAAPTASGGISASYAWSVSGTLPTGTSQNASTGALAGTLTAAGSFGPVTITVTDGLRVATTAAKTFTVAGALAIAGTPAATTVRGTAYSAQFAATGGSGAGYAYALASGTLPDGLTLGSSGTISGTSTTEGVWSGIIVQVTDSAGHVATSQTFSIEVLAAHSQVPLSIAWAASPPVTAFTDGDWMITPVAVAGGSGNFRYSFTGSCGETFDGAGCGLPHDVWQNLDLGAGALAGALMGTMTPAGSYGPFTVTVYDDDTGQSATTTPLVFTVAQPYAPAIAVAGPYVPGSPDTATMPPDPIGGAAYQAQLSASGGDGGPYVYSFSVGSAALPPGLTMDPATGLISGTVDDSAAGWYGQYQVIATDASNNFGLSGWFGFSVRPKLGIDGGDDMAVAEGRAFRFFYQGADGGNYTNFPPSAYGGDGAYTYTLVGALPAGLSYDAATGEVSGTPAVGTAGVYPGLSYVVTDGGGATATSGSFKLTVDPMPPVTVSTSYGGSKYYVGDNFGVSIFAEGGDGGPYTYAATTLESGALPPGIAVQGDRLSGPVSDAAVPAGNVWTFVVTATDGHGHAGTTSIQVPMDWLPLQIHGIGSITTAPGQTIPTETFSASYGSGGNTFQVVSGSLPAGLSLSAGGVLSGTVDPDVSGLFAGIVVRVTDSFGHTSTAAPFDVFVTPPGPALALAGDPPTHAYAGLYQTRFYASGGTAPYSFAVTRQPNDQAPFRVSSSGLVEAALPQGVYPDIEVTVTDAANATQSRQWTVTVDPGLKLVVPTPIKGTLGRPITPAQAQATGGSGAGYRFAMSESSFRLPKGLALDPASGIISGTPTEAIEWSQYRMQATDSAGNWATSNLFTIAIGEDLKLTGTPPADAYVGRDYGTTKPTVSGGSNQPWIYQYALTSGSLPPGLAMDVGNGRISGTPTTEGVYPDLQIRVTDPSTGETALSDTFAITVHPATQKLPVFAWFQTPGFDKGHPNGGLGTNQSVQTITAGVNTTTEIQAAAAGGTSGQYTWSITPGYPTDNMTLSAAGKVTATFPKTGTYRISLRATDAASGAYGDTSPLTVYVQELSVKVGNDVTVFDGEGVNIPILIEGGTAPYTVVKGGGMLPGGVAITPSAVLGAPQGQGGSGGVYQFSVFVTDANGLTADSGTITIGVKHRGACLYLGAGPYGVVGMGAADAGSDVRPDYDGYLALFTLFTDPGGYVAVDVNSNAVGARSFDWLAWGDYPIEPPYSQYSCDRLNFSVDFVQQVVLLPPASQFGTAGSGFLAKLTAVGGKPDGGYWYVARGLPSGLQIDNRTGYITGVISPTAAGLYQIVVTAMDAYGLTDQKTMQMVVQPGG